MSWVVSVLRRVLLGMNKSPDQSPPTGGLAPGPKSPRRRKPALALGETPEKDNLFGDRAARLFTYLTNLSQLKTRVAGDLVAYETLIWLHKVPSYRGWYSTLSADALEGQDMVWLEVRGLPREP